MSSAVLLFAAAAALLCVSTVSADSLYPKCSGTVLEDRAPQTQPERILKTLEDGKLMKGVRVSCVAFAVRSLSSSGVCEIPHQTQYPFRLFLRATGITNDNKPYTNEYDIRDTVGGSVNRLTVTSPYASKFEVVFQNAAQNKDCMLGIRAIITATELTGTDDANAPTIVGVDPQTVYQNSPTHFVLKHSTNPTSSESSNDIMFLVPIESLCTDTITRTSLSKESDAETLKKYLTGYGSNTAAYDVWVSSKPAADNYRVCHATDGKGGSEIALLTVFKGNPNYFDVVTGDDSEGKIFVGSPVTIKFFGYDLDTRPNRDLAKLVDDSHSCDAGGPAGGVPIATDLGPADSYGVDTTFTTWTFTITKGGSFRVCYKRAGSSWVDVPSIDELPAGAAPTVPPAPAPIPTNPVNGKSCMLATVRKDAPTYPTMLKLTLAAADVPSYFRSVLSEVLCVAALSLSFIPVPQEPGAGGAVLYMDIYCDPKVCSAQDRKDYLLEIAKQQTAEYKSLGISAVEEVANKGINGFTKDFLNNDLEARRHHGLVLIIMCLTLVALAALGVYGWVQYKKNQHHFIQFGVGVDDEDLEIDEPPPRSAVDPEEA